EELLKKRDDKKAELDKLRKTSPETLWENDLDAFLEELDIVETQEREAAEQGKAVKLGGKVKVQGKSAKSGKSAVDNKPSANGRRIEPKIDPEYYKKAASAADGPKKVGRGAK